MGGVVFSKPRILQERDAIDGFSSGSPLVDSWLKMRARKAREAGTAVVYVTFADEKLAGFYSLSAQSIVRSDASGWITRNAPEQIPVILLGILGVGIQWQGCGLGRDLLLDAVHRAELVAEQIGARTLVVDPVDDKAGAFYAHFGFQYIPGMTRMFAKLR